jgi:serine/threonine-protein kinase
VLQQLAGDIQQLRVRDVIGEGGMGIVHAAEQVALGRTVAVKSLKPGRRDAAASLDLLREAWVTGSLEHPNIVPVHYLKVESDATPSIVLKRVEGVEWSRLVRDAGEVERRFGAKDLLAWNLGILLQVLNALRFAHRHGILHRDLQPSNVMVGDYGEVYLLDWGIAVSLRDDGSGRLPLASRATQLAGTPCYMAPEMLGRDGDPPLSERTDVYLAGAVLFELITGGPPHAGTSSLAVIASVISSRPEFPPGVAPELARICQRAMQPDPEARFESIDALRTAIERYLEHRGSAQLASRARERLDQLLEQLAPSASIAARQEDIYRLFGACRYGFRDALAVWPENEDARRGLVQAVVAVAEFELAADRPQAAVSLLGELDEPHPLQETARAAAKAHALRVAELERIGRQHDRSIGTRTRMFLTVLLGATFTIFPIGVAQVAWFRRAPHWAHAAWAALFVGVVGAGRWWARESMGATLINRRIAATGMFLFVVQLVIAVGGWLAGTDVYELWRWNLVLYLAIIGMATITIDLALWPACVGFVAAFLASSHDPSRMLYFTSAANAVFTIVVAWRWRPATLRYSEEERARLGKPSRR